MNSLYLWINLGAFSIPFLYSFHPKLKLYKQWKAIFLAIALTMCFYIPWDIVFTQNGVWGFNKLYYLEKTILKLPIEEWLFFICIPYACIFTHYALLFYFPNLGISEKILKPVSYGIAFLLFVLSFIYHSNWYTVINFLYAGILILCCIKTNPTLLRRYFVTFSVILIPFFIVNGLLTGSFVPEEVVWYNPNQIIGIRLFTIPIEDTVYAFTMVLTNLWLVEFFKKKFTR